MALGSGADDNPVDVFRLPDGIGDRPGDGVGRRRHLVAGLEDPGRACTKSVWTKPGEMMGDPSAGRVDQGRQRRQPILPARAKDQPRSTRSQQQGSGLEHHPIERTRSVG